MGQFAYGRDDVRAWLVTIEAGDTIVLASSLVPGNETAVYKVINGLARLGATVVHKETARVHVSGHAPAGASCARCSTWPSPGT